MSFNTRAQLGILLIVDCYSSYPRKCRSSFNWMHYCIYEKLPNNNIWLPFKTFCYVFVWILCLFYSQFSFVSHILRLSYLFLSTLQIIQLGVLIYAIGSLWSLCTFLCPSITRIRMLLCPPPPPSPKPNFCVCQSSLEEEWYLFLVYTVLVVTLHL